MDVLRFWQAHAVRGGWRSSSSISSWCWSRRASRPHRRPRRNLRRAAPARRTRRAGGRKRRPDDPQPALLGFLLPLPFIGGVGPRTAMVALTLYALLPIVRTTVDGVTSIDRAIVEAGVAMGMTGRQLLWMVELPLALPQIVAGVRVAAVIAVGTATIAAAIGAGGLGEYIFRGLAMVDTTTILAGAVPAAALALVVDGALGWAERRLRDGDARAPGARSRPPGLRPSCSSPGASPRRSGSAAGRPWWSARRTSPSR
jgi:hypothetical protein